MSAALRLESSLPATVCQSAKQRPVTLKELMIGLLPNCAGAKPSLRRRAVRRVMLSDLSIMGSGFVDAFNSLPLMTIVMLRSS